MISCNILENASNELIFHDFVSYNICQVPSRPFLKKNWKIEKNQILLLKNLCKNIEKNEKMFFLQQIMLFQHEFDFYMFLAFFWGTYHMFWSKCQNFWFFTNKIFINDQFDFLTSSSKNSHQKRLLLVSMDR